MQRKKATETLFDDEAVRLEYRSTRIGNQVPRKPRSSLWYPGEKEQESCKGTRFVCDLYEIYYLVWIFFSFNKSSHNKGLKKSFSFRLVADISGGLTTRGHWVPSSGWRPLSWYLGTWHPIKN